MTDRIENLLRALLNDDTVDYTPISRSEKYLKACCEKCGCAGLPNPLTRIETLLYALADKLAHSSAVIEPLSVTQNGTHTAPEGVDGFNPVTVNVPIGATNVKRWEITLTEDVVNTTKIVENDADVAAHYKDGSAFCFIIRKGDGYTDMGEGTRWAIARETAFDKYGLNAVCSAWGTGTTTQKAILSPLKIESSLIKADESGNIFVRSGFLAGTYDLIFCW